MPGVGLFDGIHDDGEVEAVGAVGNVDGADHDGFAEGEEGVAFEDGLADDGFGDTGNGAGLAEAGLLDFGFEHGSVFEGGEGCVEVEADVEVGELGLLGVVVGGVGAGRDGDFVALLDGGALAVDCDHGDVLGADGLAGVEFRDGVGEAVGFVGDVEGAYEGFDTGELFGVGGDDESVLVGYENDLHVWIEGVANRDHKLIGIVLIGDVLEEDGFGLGVSFCASALLGVCGQLTAVGRFGVLSLCREGEG